MKNLHSYVLLFFFGIICIPNDCYAQELAEVPTDDLGDVSDQFQEHFFEALKQKGIENYELALDALRKAENAAKGDTDLVAVVTFEMGRCRTTLFYFTPVLPNPPLPLEVSSKVSTSSHTARSCFAITNWAIRSPSSMVNG